MKKTLMEDVKVVVIDDQDILRELITDTMEMFLNRNVVSFNNAYHAWQHILDNHVDMIISDVDMPDMNGLQLLGKVKELFPGIICVMMSGRKDNLWSAAELGAEHFILKPFRVRDFVRIVEKYIVGEEK